MMEIVGFRMLRVAPSEDRQKLSDGLLMLWITRAGVCHRWEKESDSDDLSSFEFRERMQAARQAGTKTVQNKSPDGLLEREISAQNGNVRLKQTTGPFFWSVKQRAGRAYGFTTRHMILDNRPLCTTNLSNDKEDRYHEWSLCKRRQPTERKS